MFGRRASGHLGFPKYWRNPGGGYNPENSISRACAHPERRVVTTDWTLLSEAPRRSVCAHARDINDRAHIKRIAEQLHLLLDDSCASTPVI